MGVFIKSSKPVMKGARVETVEAARKEYKKLLEDGWKKPPYSIATFRNSTKKVIKLSYPFAI